MQIFFNHCRSNFLHPRVHVAYSVPIEVGIPHKWHGDPKLARGGGINLFWCPLKLGRRNLIENGGHNVTIVKGSHKGRHNGWREEQF